MPNKFSFKSPTSHNKATAAVIFAVVIIALLVLIQSCGKYKPTKSEIDYNMAVYKNGYVNGINSAMKYQNKFELDSAYASDTTDFKNYLNGK